MPYENCAFAARNLQGQFAVRHVEWTRHPQVQELPCPNALIEWVLLVERRRREVIAVESTVKSASRDAQAGDAQSSDGGDVPKGLAGLIPERASKLSNLEIPEMKLPLGRGRTKGHRREVLGQRRQRYSDDDDRATAYAQPRRVHA